MSKALIFVGYNCNESCFFCSAEVQGRKHINYSTLQILKVIKEKREGNDEVEFIGGEILIRKDALLLFQFCKKIGYKEISIETNGTRLSDLKYFEKVLQSGITSIVMSIHGSTPDINDVHTGLKNSFILKDMALYNAQKLSKIYHFSMFTNFVVTSQNINNVTQFIDYIKKFSYIKKYIFAFCRPLSSYSQNYSNYLTSFTSIKEVFEKIPLDPKIRIQYLPLCVISPSRSQIFQEGFFKGQKIETTRIDGEGNKNSLETAIQDHTEYFIECDSCKYRNSCRGVWSEYVNHFQMVSPPLLIST